MLDCTSTVVYRFSKGWVALAALIIFVLFIILVFPKQVAIADETSSGAGTPDLSFFYTPTDLYRMAEAYGESGRETFIQTRLTFDVVWPLVYLFFLATSISWLFRQLFPPAVQLARFNLLPLLGALFDYLENFFNILIMARYPATTKLIDWLAPVFTMLKWVALGASGVLLISLLMLFIIKILRRRKDVA